MWKFIGMPSTVDCTWGCLCPWRYVGMSSRLMWRWATFLKSSLVYQDALLMGAVGHNCERLVDGVWFAVR